VGECGRRSHYVVEKRVEPSRGLSGDEPGYRAMKMSNGPMGPVSIGAIEACALYRHSGERTIGQDSTPSVCADSLHRQSGTTTDPQD
jgi:hypothetical protein